MKILTISHAFVAELEMPKVQKERQAAAQRKGKTTQQAVRQSITFNKDFGQHILRVTPQLCLRFSFN